MTNLEQILSIIGSVVAIATVQTTVILKIMSAKFEAVDRRFETVDVKFASIDVKFKANEDRQDKIAAEIKADIANKLLEHVERSPHP